MTTITSRKTAELKAFPPITDTVVWIKQVDWADVRQRCLSSVNNVGLVLAVKLVKKDPECTLELG